MPRVADVVEALKLEHTIFSLPFAYLALWVAAAGDPAWRTVGWVTLAMVGARTAGMALNRLIDLPIDRRNPRTKNWPVPAGQVTPILLIFLILTALILFFVSAGKLNPLCLKLSPIALGLLILYPYLKRFTWACHFGLGLVLACAPLAGWLAVTGAWNFRVFPLGMGVLLWVAGFDILYALLDFDFDKREKIHSIPQRFGKKAALWISGGCHLFSSISFALFGTFLGLGVWFWLGWAILCGLLVYEHQLVTPTRLDRINKAFFAINGWVSITFFLFTLIDLKVVVRP